MMTVRLGMAARLIRMASLGELGLRLTGRVRESVPEKTNRDAVRHLFDSLPIRLFIAIQRHHSVMTKLQLFEMIQWPFELSSVFELGSVFELSVLIEMHFTPHFQSQA
jgi:hypothetical protein